MYRQRLRPRYSDAELLEIYSKRHDPWQFPDHRLRIQKTLEMAERLFGEVGSAADLSCGDGYILSNIDSWVKYFGDYTAGWAYQGPIEETIHDIPDVELFVCCETIEHLDNPDAVLSEIRRKSQKLLLSTPMMRWYDENPEHYWAWDKHAVQLMLQDTGWETVDYEETYYEPGYRFQIWGCL